MKRFAGVLTVAVSWLMRTNTSLTSLDGVFAVTIAGVNTTEARYNYGK